RESIQSEKMNMATYSDIQAWVKKEYGFTAKTCWIAHILSEHGKTSRKAPNRQHPDKRVHPCPDHRRPQVEEALRHFGKI
ncbi:hypothetical protein, partial [Acetobacter tropicalis]